MFRTWKVAEQWVSTVGVWGRRPEIENMTNPVMGRTWVDRLGPGGSPHGPSVFSFIREEEMSLEKDER